MALVFREELVQRKGRPSQTRLLFRRSSQSGRLRSFREERKAALEKWGSLLEGRTEPLVSLVQSLSPPSSRVSVRLWANCLPVQLD
jgi:hypothetical protein